MAVATASTIPNRRRRRSTLGPSRPSRRPGAARERSGHPWAHVILLSFLRISGRTRSLCTALPVCSLVRRCGVSARRNYAESLRRRDTKRCSQSRSSFGGRVDELRQCRRANCQSVASRWSAISVAVYRVVTVFSMFFSEMSGSTTADVAVMSRALGGPMKKEGYSRAFIAAIIAAASTIAAWCRLVSPLWSMAPSATCRLQVCSWRGRSGFMIGFWPDDLLLFF